MKKYTYIHICIFIYIYVCVIQVGLFIPMPEATGRFPLYAFTCIIPLASPSMSPFQCTLESVFSVKHSLQVSFTNESSPYILNKLIYFSILKEKNNKTKTKTKKNEATKIYLPLHWALANHLISHSWIKSLFSQSKPTHIPLVIFSHHMLTIYHWQRVLGNHISPTFYLT